MFKTLMTLHAKWYGLVVDDFDTAWEPWSSLRDTTLLHLYFIQNKLMQLIPKKFHEKYPSEFPPKNRQRSTTMEQSESSSKRTRPEPAT